jgi:hypothetical protein
LIFYDPNYKRSAHLIFDRVASVAAMQEWLRIFPKIVATGDIGSGF